MSSPLPARRLRAWAASGPRNTSVGALLVCSTLDCSYQRIGFWYSSWLPHGCFCWSWAKGQQSVKVLSWLCKGQVHPAGWWGLRGSLPSSAWALLRFVGLDLSWMLSWHQPVQGKRRGRQPQVAISVIYTAVAIARSLIQKGGDLSPVPLSSWFKWAYTKQQQNKSREWELKYSAPHHLLSPSCLSKILWLYTSSSDEAPENDPNWYA